MSVVSTYTLFGMFETPEAAQQAAGIIQDSVTKIRDWFVAHPDERLGTWEDMPNPVEFEVAEKYQLDRNNNWGLFDCYVFRATALGRLVMVHEEERNWNVHHEILYTFMERLGAKEITIQDSVDAQISGIDVHLSCTAPDAHTADRVYQECERYFEIPLEYEDFIAERDLNEHGVIDLAIWFGSEEGMGFRVAQGTIRRVSERELIFDIQMFDIERQFPNFIKSLQEEGFTDLSYTFTQAEDAVWKEFGNGR